MPDDTNWTGAEIKACCRLPALLDVPLAQSAQNVVPVAVTAAESVDRLRNWARSRCLSAQQPGIYHLAGTKAGARRKVRRDSSINWSSSESHSRNIHASNAFASQPFHQFGQRNSQSIGDRFDISQGQISFPPLDPTNVSPVELTSPSETLLGIALLLPQFADSQSKSLQNVGSHSHGSHWNVDNEYRSTDYE
jgi:hypothetical protein